jgi:hypothetical protein
MVALSTLALRSPERRTAIGCLFLRLNRSSAFSEKQICSRPLQTWR